MCLFSGFWWFRNCAFIWNTSQNKTEIVSLYFINKLVSLRKKRNLFSVILYFFCLFTFLSLFFFIGGDLGYIFGCDLISYGLILLSLWICVLTVLTRVYFPFGLFFRVFFFLLLLFLLLYCIVPLEELVYFFFCFFCESRLFLFLILGWGYQPERVQAGIHLLFYTLVAPIPLLVGILFVYSSLGSSCLFLLCENNSLVGGLFYVRMVFAFLVKMPMFMVHLWLPRAHVEAPVSGSIIWAGVLLKLCGYGLLRVFPVLFKFGFRFGVVLSCFKFGWWSFCWFILYTTDWFEAVDCLFFCSSYKYSYCWYYNVELWGGGFVDLLLVPVPKPRHYVTIIFIISVKHFTVWDYLLFM